MTVSRRDVTTGTLSLLGATALGTNPSLASIADYLGIGDGIEDFWLATDAYIYGYPLVTMEYTRRVMTNVGGARRHPRADGPVHQGCASIPTPRSAT